MVNPLNSIGSSSLLFLLKANAMNATGLKNLLKVYSFDLNHTLSIIMTP